MALYEACKNCKLQDNTAVYRIYDYVGSAGNVY